VTAPQTCSRQRKPLDAGGFQPEISSFRLHLAAEGKISLFPVKGAGSCKRRARPGQEQSLL